MNTHHTLILLGLSALAHGQEPIKVTAWLHRYDFSAAVDSLIQRQESVAEVSPAWYMIGADGAIEEIPLAPVNDSELRAYVTERCIPLRPLLMNVTATGTKKAEVKALFDDPILRYRHIQQIVRLVCKNHYEGIDLDYEGFRHPDLDDLATLVEETARVLHDAGKTLSVSIEVQATDDVLPAWRRIGVAADFVRVMTYGQVPKTPGPLVELNWVRGHLERAIKAIPVEKLIHGIAIYGLDWGPRGVGSGTWAQYTKMAAAGKSDIQRDEATSTPWFRQDDHVVWYEDQQSVQRKIDVGYDLGIRRVALWRLGGEDPRILDTILSPKQ